MKKVYISISDFSKHYDDYQSMLSGETSLKIESLENNIMWIEAPIKELNRFLNKTKIKVLF